MERDGGMKTYCLDTSVATKWFSEHDESDLSKALSIRDEILEGRFAVIVPELFFYELANALRYNAGFTDKDVKDAVKSVLDMGFEIRKIESDIMEYAIDIAFKFNVSIYDAYFLALSQTTNMPFITADYKFAERVKSFRGPALPNQGSWPGIVRLSEL